MGTMDGIVNEDGSPEISDIGGTIRTVNDEPRVQMKGRFKGTRDGVDTTFNFKSSAPVEVVDVGGGTNGIAATATYNGKIGGGPLSGKNLPLQIAAPSGAEDNLEQDWNIQLVIGTPLLT
jgi:hypothetical protein